MAGPLVLVGTLVPFQTLLDYLEGGESLDALLGAFPTVSRESACDAGAGLTLTAASGGPKAC
jgi:uncharacterized protein (DUF433 family)